MSEFKIKRESKMIALLWINMGLAMFTTIIYTFIILAGLKNDNKKQRKKDWSIYITFSLPIIVSTISIFISIYFIFFEL